LKRGVGSGKMEDGSGELEDENLMLDV